ncbi:hypothetical protein BN1723_001160, partial [Verticillium longisporum]
MFQPKQKTLLHPVNAQRAKLMERMEEKMKGTPAEKVLPDMFSGKIKTYISCVNVDYESSRIEDFWDIQLNVSGNKNLIESFQDYIQVEKMDGENQYYAGDEFKLQDANKGVIFTSFPDVLHLQLKRFEYDIQRDMMMKINDRYEFPEEFDAAPFLIEGADKSEPWTYQLHGVLVHSGDLNAGHYYAFLKPEKDGWFYKYDDDKVTKATMREVLEENFGGEYRLPNGSLLRAPLQKKAPIMRQNSAYMLVYIRQTRLDKILRPVTSDDIPTHLKSRIEEETALREARKKERMEEHLYIGVKVITNETYKQHGGTDLTNFDPEVEDASTPKFYRVLRTMTMEELTATIAEDMQQDPRKIRCWVMRPPVQRTTARPTTATRQAIASPLHSPRAPVSPPQRIDPFAREDEFKSNGLLGKVYEDRKHHAELAERTSDDSPAEGPFTGGLLQNRLQEESRLQEPNRQARSLDRSNTKRRPSAPPERRFQLDATAEEPPLESPFTGGLLQTRLQEESRQARSLDRSNTRRRPTASERRYQPEPSPEPAVPVAGPFTGGGLLQTRNQDPARQTRAPERANTLRAWSSSGGWLTLSTTWVWSRCPAPTMRGPRCWACAGASSSPAYFGVGSAEARAADMDAMAPDGRCVMVCKAEGEGGVAKGEVEQLPI